MNEIPSFLALVQAAAALSYSDNASFCHVSTSSATSVTLLLSNAILLLQIKQNASV